MHPFCLKPPSPHPHPTPLGHHRALARAPPSGLLYTWRCVYLKLLVQPLLFPLLCPQSILCIRVSIPTPQKTHQYHSSRSIYMHGLPSLAAQMVKNPPPMRETWVRSLDWEDPRRRAWHPTPVLLPGESPWTGEPGGLQSMGLQRVGHD